MQIINKLRVSQVGIIMCTRLLICFFFSPLISFSVIPRHSWVFEDMTRQKLSFPSPLPPTLSQQYHLYLFFKTTLHHFLPLKTADIDEVVLHHTSPPPSSPSLSSIILMISSRQLGRGRGREDADMTMWQVRLCHEVHIINISVGPSLRGFDELRDRIIPKLQGKNPVIPPAETLPRRKLG